MKTWTHPGGKLRELGAESLTDEELLAILLSTGTKGKPAEEIAKEILDKFGSFKGMANQPLEKFLEIKGLGDRKNEKEATVSWSEYEADHVLSHSKGGKPEIFNAQKSAKV